MYVHIYIYIYNVYIYVYIYVYIVGGLPDHTRGSQVAFRGKHIPYKIKCHSNHNCKHCLKFNTSH